jgi:ribosomal protein S18 acetylase RimI-like enzyme
MDYTIRKLDAESFICIANLYGYATDDEDFIERYNRVVDKKDDCYAVFVNDECIADVTVTYSSADKAAAEENIRAYMSGLLVKENYRNKKIATALIMHLTEELKEKGYKELSVLSDTDNVVACKLYNKLGFRKENTYNVEDMSFDLLVYGIYRAL